jgi:hypothetical protein
MAFFIIPKRSEKARAAKECQTQAALQGYILLM